MGRPQSSKVTRLESLFRKRIACEMSPGDRFLSNRQIAGRFGISYQTAHRMVSRLEEEGLLERTPQSGSFVAGAAHRPKGALLLFDSRARDQGSFGNKLREVIRGELLRRKVSVVFRWKIDPSRIPEDWYPVLWQRGDLVDALAGSRRRALVLNETAPLGISGSYLDRLSVDHFSGGVVAGEMARDHSGCRKCLVVGGPAGDQRSNLRIAGFRSVIDQAEIVYAGGWDAESARSISGRLKQSNADTVFCVNDRLAATCAMLLRGEKKRPFVIGFDGAPVAEKLSLPTVAIPWGEFASRAAEIIKRRIDGDGGVATSQLLLPRPAIF